MIPTINFRVALDLDEKEFVLTDQTDYAGENITESNVKGKIVATGPSGVFHTGSFGTPDVDPNVSPNSAAISLPLGDDNLVEQGAYSFNYAIRVTDQQFDLQVVKVDDDGTIYFNGDYQNILENISSQDIRNSGLVVVGTLDGLLNPLYNNATGLTSATPDNPSVAIVEEYVIRVVSTYDEEYAKGFTLDFAYPKPCLEIESDCDCSTMTITDDTEYSETQNGEIDTESRTITAKYPQGITPQPDDETSSLQKFTIYPIYTGTWTVSVSNTVVYNYSSWVKVTTTVTGTREYKVTCENSLCDVFECMANIYGKYNNLLTYNSKESGIYQQKLVKIQGAWMNYVVGRKCGEDVSQYLADIKEIAEGCGCGCDETSSTGPQQVVPVCENAVVTGTGTYIFQSAGNGITITLVTVGTTHTYTFSLDQGVMGEIVLDKITNDVSIADLKNVNTTGLTSNMVLKWTGSEWIVVKYSLANLVDVDTTSVAPAASHALMFDNSVSKWKNRKIVLADLGNVDLTGLADNYILKYDLASLTWKAEVDSPGPLSSLTDVTITGIADQHTLVWSHSLSKWINVDNFTWQNFDTADYSADYQNFGNPYNVLQYKYNAGRKSISIRGAFENTTISPAVDVTVYTIANPALRPVKTCAITYMSVDVDGAGNPGMLPGIINAAGEIKVLGGHVGGVAIVIPEQEISLT